MKNLQSFDEFSELNEARQPKWWDSGFTTHVIKAYKNNEFDIKDPNSIAEWDKKYNGGVQPKPAFNTLELVKYYLATGKGPDGKK